MTERPVTILAVSDTHCGGTTGLCPPEGAETDDGQRVLPSEDQVWLWEKWMATMAETRAIRRFYKSDLRVILNGDLVDGPGHHGTTQSMSLHPGVQDYIARRCFAEITALKPDKVYVVRGTKSHTGPGGSEDAVAFALRAERRGESKVWSTQDIRIAIHGKLIEAAHHGKGLGRRPHTLQNGANAMAWEVAMRRTDRTLPIPDLVIRSHLHQFADSGRACRRVRAIYLPSFQLKTDYAWQIDPDSVEEVGGLLVTVFPDDRAIDVHPVLFEKPLSQEV